MSNSFSQTLTYFSLSVALVSSPVEVEMIVECVRSGYALDWVTIRTIYADETSHIQRWPHVKNFFRVVWQTRQAMRGKR